MSKKSGISRTLKYGGLYAEKTFAMIIFIVVIYAAISYYQGGFGDGNHKSLMIPFYFGMISVITVSIIQILNVSRFIPITISFGSLRKETFVGIQCMNLILVVQCVAVIGIYLLFDSTNFNGMKTFIILVYIILLIIFSGLGQLIGAASIKFGKLGAFLIALFIFLMIIGGTVALAFGGASNIDITINDFSLAMKAIAALVAVIVYIAGSYISYRILQNYEVRA